MIQSDAFTIISDAYMIQSEYLTGYPTFPWRSFLYYDAIFNYTPSLWRRDTNVNMVTGFKSDQVNGSDDTSIYSIHRLTQNVHIKNYVALSYTNEIQVQTLSSIILAWTSLLTNYGKTVQITHNIYMSILSVIGIVLLFVICYWLNVYCLYITLQEKHVCLEYYTDCWVVVAIVCFLLSWIYLICYCKLVALRCWYCSTICHM